MTHVKMAPGSNLTVAARAARWTRAFALLVATLTMFLAACKGDSPSGDPPLIVSVPMPRRPFHLMTSLEVESLSRPTPGVSLEVTTERVVGDVLVWATLRNEGPGSVVVSASSRCSNGEIVYRDGATAIIYQSFRLRPADDDSISDDERRQGGSVWFLQPGEFLVGTTALRRSSARCGEEPSLSAKSIQIGETSSIQRVIVAYDIGQPIADPHRGWSLKQLGQRRGRKYILPIDATLRLVATEGRIDAYSQLRKIPPEQLRTTLWFNTPYTPCNLVDP